jgi:hypothetical protein
MFSAVAGFDCHDARSLTRDFGYDIRFLFAIMRRVSSYAWKLRAELAERARSYALERGLPHCLSYSDEPVICFEAFEQSHGNFHCASYRAIRSNPQWRRRLGKVHTTAGRILPRMEGVRRRELDSCTSSDALLMNVFCHPNVRKRVALSGLLGVAVGSLPAFGVRARVPLASGLADGTEVDMLLGDVLVEAKLTESDFQKASRGRLKLYRDFRTVFDAKRLPHTAGVYEAYQLIRNVLAAYARGGYFCTLLDARRPDLIAAWYATICCIRHADLRTRCKVLTWQELAAALPKTMQDFLEAKYGIA